MTRVLIVDDKEENLYYLQALFKAQGWAVDSALHGAQALVLARRSPPDLIVSDLLMPIMDGYTLLRHWKADSLLKRIPFIVYTATYTEAEDEQLALSMGADAFILKPSEPDEFMARVREVQARADVAPAGKTRHPVGDEKALLKVYSEMLIRKLEEKALQLEASNLALQKDIAERNRVAAALRDSEAAAQQSEQEQRQLAVQLETERARLLAAQEVAKVGSWETDLATLAVTWSAQTYRIFEAPPDFQPTHEGFLAFVHPDDRQKVDDAFAQSLKSPGLHFVEHRVAGRDGKVRTVEERWEVRTDSAGNAVRAIGTCQDITERRALEERLLRSQRLESVGQLTGGMAHDFNNLLTVILGNAEILVEQLAGNTKLQPLAAMVVSAAERGAGLTQRLLAFARKQALAPVPVATNDLVATMEPLLRRTLGEHIEIALAPSPDLWPALVDPAQLDNALLNLCLNARDAMPDGGRLDISTFNIHLDEDFTRRQVDLRPGDYVVLAVSDTGMGIAPEDLSRVFEPFFTTKETGKGTGLGLAMIYGFAKQSGGHVSIDSSPGHGTSVRLYLPRASGALGASAMAPAAAPVTGGSGTILLVEDDELVRRYAHDQLIALGYRVIVAIDGAAALQVLRETTGIDLLFTDVVMPGMSGRELADAACRLQPRLKVLYTSGYTDNVIVHHGRLDPGVVLLAKPYRREELARRVHEAMTRPAATK